MVELTQKQSEQAEGTFANIKLVDYFNLYPKIEVFIDQADKNKILEDIGDKKDKEATKMYANTYDVSDCCSNIKIKTSLYNNCGTLTCKLIHSKCQEYFHVGDRIRIYMDSRCWFCGFIFTTQYSDENEMSVTAFDWLRYFKSPLTYSKEQLLAVGGQTGLTADSTFQKICQDLAIPFEIKELSSIPVPAQNYLQKSAFNILEFAINQTALNSDTVTGENKSRQYFMYYHETYFDADKDKDYKDTELFKTSGKVIWALRNNLTVDCVLDDDFVYKYNFTESIDKQSFNEVNLFQDKKSYVGKDGKTSKKGNKTGTQIIAKENDNYHKALWGYLPYYHKAPDGYTQAQAQQVAKELLNTFNHETHDLSISCYGIAGMRAGYLVPIALHSIGGTTIGEYKKDEEGNYVLDKEGKPELIAEYRTVKECEMLLEHPLKMNLRISSGRYSEVG